MEFRLAKGIYKENSGAEQNGHDQAEKMKGGLGD
jgi:hypothetical protein